MFKIHKYLGRDRYFTLPPTGHFAINKSHTYEASLMGMGIVEYYAYLLKTYPSVRLTKYDSFISYSMNERDIKKLISKLNSIYRKVK